MARPWKHPKTGIYWLRRGVPTDLRAAVGKREEKLSLKTKDPGEAKRRHAAALTAVEERWANLRLPGRKLGHDELHRVSVAVYDRCLELKGPPGIVWDSDLGDDIWDAPPESAEISADARWAHRWLHKTWCLNEAQAHISEFGLKVDDQERLKLAKAIGSGVQRAVLELKRQARGDFSPDPLAPQVASASRARVAATPRSHEPVPFQSLLDGWAAEKQPTEKTVYSWKRVLNQIGVFVGHTDAAQLTPDELLRWKAALLDAGLRTKTIRDSKLAPLRAILQWGVDNRKLATNPASRIVIDVRSKMSQRIRGFTEDEAALILRHAAQEQDPIRRWVPLLCAYSGARLSEVCQLRGEDIFQQGDVWSMKFDPGAGSLKNENSERAIPLHPAIAESGFMKFVAAARSGPLFASLAADRFGNRGGTGTKILGRWVRGMGLTDERLSPSHSWRHRFKTLGRQFGLAPDIVNAMTGHHRKSVADNYGEFPIDALYRELSKIPTVVT